MNKKQKKAIDVIADVGGEMIGASVGATIGALVAGPVGSIGGAIIGCAAEKGFNYIATEIKERVLSKREVQKIETVISCAAKRIEQNLSFGIPLRSDDFYTSKIDDRSSAEEIIEALAFAAQRESQEKKIPLMGIMYANINFDSSVDRAMANQLIKIASDLTYRQIVILSVIGKYQNGLIKEPKRKDESFHSIHGLNNVSIATEIHDLYRKSLVHSKEAILDAAGFNPSLLTIAGMGAMISNLMELTTMPINEESNEIIAFLSGKS